MRTIAPGVDQPIPSERPEPTKKQLAAVKAGKEPACPCGDYPKWYCASWPRCVSL